MAKAKTRFVCSNCGYETVKWLGKCPECESWNTLEEAAPEAEAPPVRQNKRRPGAGTEALLVSEIPEEGASRLDTGVEELNRVLGGGAVEGSMLLVAGDPGIGKSTLLTQVAAKMSRDGRKVLYVAGEESARQVKLRAARLGAAEAQFYILPENDVAAVEERLNGLMPEVLIVDSIQTMYRPDMSSAPGSVSQVRESAALYMRYAKTSGCCVFLVGHVTKEGAIAGPRVLEHMVDAVLYFEGDPQHQYRLLRAVKNRFGSVNELGMFEMTGTGMREVPNASEALLSERAKDMSGSSVLCALEGSRPILADLQALVSPTVFGNPRRMAQGVDQGRLYLLLAVMEKRAGLPLYNQDVYVNVAGGLQLTEPAADLAVCASVASSFRNVVLDSGVCVLGEVGLAGEVRAIPQAERRVAECARLGFTTVVLPKGNLRSFRAPSGIDAVGVSTVSQALSLLIGKG